MVEPKGSVQEIILTRRQAQDSEDAGSLFFGFALKALWRFSKRASVYYSHEYCQFKDELRQAIIDGDNRGHPLVDPPVVYEMLAEAHRDKDGVLRAGALPVCECDKIVEGIEALTSKDIAAAAGSVETFAEHVSWLLRYNPTVISRTPLALVYIAAVALARREEDFCLLEAFAPRKPCDLPDNSERLAQRFFVYALAGAIKEEVENGDTDLFMDMATITKWRKKYVDGKSLTPGRKPWMKHAYKQAALHLEISESYLKKLKGKEPKELIAEFQRQALRAMASNADSILTTTTTTTA